MKKSLVLLLLMLPLAWNWAAGENIFSQDFESVWDLNTPPAGWTIIDIGSEGQQCWYLQDWHKLYLVAWADTVFAFSVSSYKLEIGYDEWLITPDVVLPDHAGACSLTFKTYYRDNSAAANADSAFIKISADGGAHWTTLETWGTNQGSLSSPVYPNIEVTSYTGQTVRFAFNLKTHGSTSHWAANSWYIDNVAVWADDSALLSHDGTGWGPFGDNPPEDWTIYDYGTTAPAQGVPNVNDWHKNDDVAWGSGTARAYYTVFNQYPEYQDEWLISPTFSIGMDYACTLSFAQVYVHLPSTPYDGDHGYIRVSTDGGFTWPYTIQDLTETTGDQNSKIFFQYDLSSFAGESNLRIAFNFVNLPTIGDYWQIDDVSVDEYVPITQDPGVISIDAPPELIYTGANYTITATIENAGPDSTIIDSVLFQVDTGEFPEVVFSNTIYPAVYLRGYTNQQFNSSAQWSPAVDDQYTVTVTVYGSGDENPLNNSYVSIRYSQSPVAFPFVEDFERELVTDLSQWIGLGMGFGTTSNAHSPVTALWFDDDAVYPAERLAVSPPIYVSGSVDPRLKFWERSADENGPQGQEIHTVGLMPGEWDFHNFVILFQEDTSSTTLEDSLWRESSVDAGEIEGDTVRVVIWYHCGDFPDRSWYVDDVSLADPLGTVAGQVTDVNTTDPIEGAIITATWISSTTVVDTTDEGGYYSIGIIPGTVNVTVEAIDYVTDSRDVIVVDGQTTTHNVALAAPVTTIDTSPIIDTVDVGDTALYARYLYNTGTAPLEYNVTLGFDDAGLLAVNLGRNDHVGRNIITLDDTWISIASGDSGTVAPDDSAEIVFLVDFRDSSIVGDSTYQAIADIHDNAPGHSPFIPFSITAKAIGCDYVVGDVNGSDSYNGLDITFGVAYLKGGQDPFCPFGSCPIPPCDAFFYCGDVNGSCTYNGLDITYGVAYLKGGSDPIPCPDCPPIGGPATIGAKAEPAEQQAVESKSR